MKIAVFASIIVFAATLCTPSSLVRKFLHEEHPVNEEGPTRKLLKLSPKEEQVPSSAPPLPSLAAKASTGFSPESPFVFKDDKGSIIHDPTFSTGAGPKRAATEPVEKLELESASDKFKSVKPGESAEFSLGLSSFSIQNVPIAPEAAGRHPKIFAKYGATCTEVSFLKLNNIEKIEFDMAGWFRPRYRESPAIVSTIYFATPCDSLYMIAKEKLGIKPEDDINLWVHEATPAQLVPIKRLPKDASQFGVHLPKRPKDPPFVTLLVEQQTLNVPKILSDPEHVLLFPMVFFPKARGGHIDFAYKTYPHPIILDTREPIDYKEMLALAAKMHHLVTGKPATPVGLGIKLFFSPHVSAELAPGIPLKEYGPENGAILLLNWSASRNEKFENYTPVDEASEEEVSDFELEGLEELVTKFIK